MNDTIIELETKIAFLEKHVVELSDALYVQQKEIATLSKNVQQLNDKLRAAAKDEGIDPEHQKPPHY